MFCEDRSFVYEYTLFVEKRHRARRSSAYYMTHNKCKSAIYMHACSNRMEYRIPGTFHYRHKVKRFAPPVSSEILKNSVIFFLCAKFTLLNNRSNDAVESEIFSAKNHESTIRSLSA